MRHISETVYEMLVRQGLNAGGLAGPMTHENKGPALSTMASSGEVKAVTAGGQLPPIGRQEKRPMGNSGKDRGNVTPAKFTGLQLVHSSRRRSAHNVTPPRLVLVSSR